MGHVAACRPLDEIQGLGFFLKKKLMGNSPTIVGDPDPSRSSCGSGRSAC
jgi:hypothetical protein